MAFYSLRKEIVVPYSDLTLYEFIGLLLIINVNKLMQFSIRSNNSFLVFLSYFFSISFHELSHFLVSLFLFGKPRKWTIVPVKKVFEQEDGKQFISWEFGYVISENVNFINAFLIGLAPLLLIPIAYLIYTNFFLFLDINGFNIILMYLLVFFLLSNAIPSKTDLRVAFSSKIGVVLNVLFFFFLYQNFNFIKGVFYEVYQNFILVVLS